MAKSDIKPNAEASTNRISMDLRREFCLIESVSSGKTKYQLDGFRTRASGQWRWNRFQAHPG
jgi:hypothetical protein